jgi:hypothetical protein
LLRLHVPAAADLLLQLLKNTSLQAPGHNQLLLLPADLAAMISG